MLFGVVGRDVCADEVPPPMGRMDRDESDDVKPVAADAKYDDEEDVGGRGGAPEEEPSSDIR